MAGPFDLGHLPLEISGFRICDFCVAEKSLKNFEGGAVPVTVAKLAYCLSWTKTSERFFAPARTDVPCGQQSNVSGTVGHATK